MFRKAIVTAFVLFQSIYDVFSIETSTTNQTIADYISTNQNYTTLSTLIQLSSINATLLTNATVFAPTNQAFDSLPPFIKNAFTNQSSQIPEKYRVAFLKAILAYHIHPGIDINSTSFITDNTPAITTDNGKFLVALYKTGDVLYVNDAIVGARINATNGVIYSIDK